MCLCSSLPSLLTELSHCSVPELHGNENLFISSFEVNEDLIPQFMEKAQKTTSIRDCMMQGK